MEILLFWVCNMGVAEQLYSVHIEPVDGFAKQSELLNSCLHRANK